MDLNIKYDEKKNDFLRIMYEYQYIFEIKKCCGYSEWLSVYKTNTLENLYSNVLTQFHTNNKNTIHLYLLNDNGEKKKIENSPIQLKEYINNNKSFFKPIYPIGYWIIYQIYLDDGCCHKEHIINKNECVECYIHK